MLRCPICENCKTKKILAWKRYSIIRCPNCKLIFANPLPSDRELFDFYQGFLFQRPERDEIIQKTNLKIAELKNIFDLSHNEYIGKSFLDYGGGTGIAYNASLQLNLDSYYHDLDNLAKEFVIREFNLSKKHFIKDITTTSKSFDFIFSDNVIEHVKDPIVFTKNLYKKLNPGGILVIKTPNAANTESYFNILITIKNYFLPALRYNSLLTAVRSYLTRFWHCDPPRHLFSFSEQSLMEIANRVDDNELIYTIYYYRIPLLEHTLAERIFSEFKRKRHIKSIILYIVCFPFVLIEFILKGIQFLLVKLGLISSTGIILKIEKSKD